MKPFSKLAAAMVLGLGFASVAQAASFPLTVSYEFGTDSSYGPTTPYHDQEFADSYFFSLTDSANISVTLANVYLSDWSVSMIDGHTGETLISFDKPTGTFDVATLGAGSYSLTVYGNAKSTPFGNQGWYEFSITSSPAAAVPEPETYAMLLAGLGIMGVVARRRRQA